MAVPACGGVGAIVGGLLMQDSSTAARVGVGLASAALCGVMAEAWASHLDEQDRQRLAEASVEAAVTDTPRSFSNPETGVKGTVQVVEVKPQQTINTDYVVLKDRLEQTPPLEMVQSNFEARSTANVRGGPGTDYKTVGQLQGGDVRKVVGRVKGRQWLLIEEGGAGAGYVYASLLDATTREVTGDAGAGGETETVKVSTQLSCKTVQQDVVTKTGENISKKINMCQQPDGSWRFNSVA